MRKRKSNTDGSAMLGNAQECAMRYNLGVSTIRDIAKKEGAVVRLSPHCVRYNFSILDSYFNGISGE